MPNDPGREGRFVAPLFREADGAGSGMLIHSRQKGKQEETTKQMLTRPRSNSADESL